MLAVQVRGSCSWSPSRLRTAVLTGRAHEILEASGQFVVIASGPDRTTIVTSHDGVLLHFYARSGCGIVDGATVLDVQRRSGLPWRWNHRAIADYLALDHVLGDDTVLEGVHRTPPGSVLIADADADGVVVDRRDPPWPDAFSLEQLRADLESEVVGGWQGDDDRLCLTAGWDSRLLLAVLLAHGIRPPALVCGRAGSDDLEMARQISARHHLDLVECEVTAPDFVEEADRIAERSNGLLPVSHWPGVLFARHSGGARLIVGFGGEAARSYYGSIGAVPVAGHLAVSGGRWGRRFWRRRSALELDERAEAMFAPPLREALSDEAWRDRALRINATDGRRGATLDGVFVGERTPNKTGADLASLSAFGPWSAPLCATTWSQAALVAPGRRRRNDWIHRALIAQLEPGLLEFATDGISGGGHRHYFDQSQYRDPRVEEMQDVAVRHLDDLIDVEVLAGQPHLCDRLRFPLATLGMLRSLAGAQR